MLRCRRGRVARRPGMPIHARGGDAMSNDASPAASPSGPIVTFLHLSLSTSTSTLSRRCRARPRPNIVAELAWSSPCVFVAATRRRTTCEKRGLRAERRRRWCAKRPGTLAGREARRRRRALAGEQPQSPLGAAARCGQPPRVFGNSTGPWSFALAPRRCLMAARRAAAEVQTSLDEQTLTKETLETGKTCLLETGFLSRRHSLGRQHWYLWQHPGG